MVQLERARRQFEQAGARIVAISADTRATALRTRQELGLGFTIIPDSDRAILRRLDHRERFSNLDIHNPAVYILDKDGIVRFRHFGQHVADRPSPAEVWRALNEIREGA